MGIEVNADTFEKEVVQSDLPVLVDFWGPQCGPCLALKPEVEKLADQYSGRLKLAMIDASKNKRLCLGLKVLGLPTFLLYKDGEEVERLKGGDLKIDAIQSCVSNHLK